MIELISQPACSRTKKLKSWLKEHLIDYQDTSLYGLLLDDMLTDQLIASSQPCDLVYEGSMPFYLKNSLDRYAQMKKTASLTESEASEVKTDSGLSDEEKKQICKDLIRFRKFLQHNPSLIRRPILIMDEEDRDKYSEHMTLLESFMQRPQQNIECQSHCSLYLVCSKTRLQAEGNSDWPVLIIRSQAPDLKTDSPDEADPVL